jgi:hypothetical protein
LERKRLECCRERELGEREVVQKERVGEKERMCGEKEGEKEQFIPIFLPKK